MADKKLSCMTYNVGGGRRDQEKKIKDCADVICTYHPDFLAMQEANCIKYPDFDWHSDEKEIAQKLNYSYSSFHSHISLVDHATISKTNMVDAIFDDCEDWQVGNALVSKYKFTRLLEPDKIGLPRSIPIYKTPLYEGTRDTESRYAILTRLKFNDLNPFIVTTHLSTLIDERGNNKDLNIYNKAASLRKLEIENIINLLDRHVLKNSLPIILLGDFNAEFSEDSLQRLLDAGFMWLKPEGIYSHLKHKILIDHIFCFPSNKIASYKCQVIDTQISRSASDHLPVFAEIFWK